MYQGGSFRPRQTELSKCYAYRIWFLPAVSMWELKLQNIEKQLSTGTLKSTEI